jgi:hypothetical protein
MRVKKTDFDMGQQLPLPERIPRPNTLQSQQLLEMGIQCANDVDTKDQTDKKDAKYVDCVLPEGWRWEDDTQYEHSQLWRIVDNDGFIRATVNGCWKGAYDNELFLKVASLNKEGGFKLYRPSWSRLVGEYKSFVSRLGGNGEDGQKLADEAYDKLLKEYLARRVQGYLEEDDYPTKLYFMDEYEKRLRDRIRQLEFASSSQGASAGYGKCIPDQLSLLRELRKENPVKHDAVIEGDSAYRALYKAFPAWFDNDNLTSKYKAMDNGPVLSLVNRW